MRLVNPDPTLLGTTACISESPRASSSIQISPPVSKHDYPNIRFWTRAEWEEWRATPTGLRQKVTRGPAPYLEHENGEAVTEELLDSIRKTIRGIWFEFGTKGLLPMTWSKLIHSSRLLFHNIVENKHPLFRFAADGWKLDLLCSTSYPSWRKNHLNANGDYVKQSKKAKQEDNTDIELDSQGKKRLRSSEPELSKKRVKGIVFFGL